MKTKEALLKGLEELMGHYEGGDEPLCPELAAYHERGGRFEMIRHPLLYSVPHFKLKNRECNLRLKLQEAELEEAVEAGDWGRAVFLHERPHRLLAFLGYRSRMKYDTARELLRDIWTDSENIWQNKQKWGRQLRWLRSRGWTMVDEPELFDELPDEIEIFRGAHYSETSKAKLGFSWTTERKIAEWFMKRFNQRGKLWTGIVEKKAIVGHLTGRGESEIIALPEDLFSAHILPR